ncbi:HIRAN domain-containing protein [Novosphingobium sp. 9]|uniref:HIRAN domain-containing protein n=1 Tax=Novosphingobium sp. 9 TaxID=2025349 RepID=UPI0021B5195F|nr:HIRAN domain-containing protein [Novosphingobium sp. 9]
MSLAVVGAQYENPDGTDRRYEILLCVPGEPVELRPEPANPRDPHAIAVFSVRRTQIGYITAERAPRLGAIIRSGREVQCLFQGKAQFGAWIRVAFDGETPVVAIEEAHSARRHEQHDDFYPDDIWPDD